MGKPRRPWRPTSAAEIREQWRFVSSSARLNEFKDNDLEFAFGLWKAEACHACAEPFEVQGTYKVIKEMHYDGYKKDWVANWKMVVDTAKRVPIPNN